YRGAKGRESKCRSAAVLRRSSGSRSVSEVSFLPGIGSLHAPSSQPLSIGAEILPRPNQLPRRSRTRHRARVGRDSHLAGSNEAAISSSAWKSSAPPCTGRAQTSSRVKSGVISRIRQGRDSCAVFGSLMPILHPYGFVWMLGGPLASVNTVPYRYVDGERPDSTRRMGRRG